MNAHQLNLELNKLMSASINEGVLKGQMSPAELIGTLEMHKLAAERAIAAAVARAQQSPIIRAQQLPPAPN